MSEIFQFFNHLSSKTSRNKEMLFKVYKCKFVASLEVTSLDIFASDYCVEIENC